MAIQNGPRSHSDTGKKTQKSSFDELRPRLNPLILSALSRISLCYPTQVQKQFIPLALTGKDVLARSGTGSGKTLAYVIPIIQSLIEHRLKPSSIQASDPAHSNTHLAALVLVPTRELSEQVTNAFNDLCRGLGDQLVFHVLNLAGQHNKRPKKNNYKVGCSDPCYQPNIMVSTPARLLEKFRSSQVDLSRLSFLVLDEADLILSYGHSFDEIKDILAGSSMGDRYTWRFPSFYQSFLLSATMTSEVTQLKSLVLRNPEVLIVKESVHELESLTQFSVKVNQEQDKFLLIYVIFRLKLIKGKGLVFVNSIDKSYQLKLFLEKFGIRSGVLNAELPFNSRYHAVQEFNKGVFDYLIATDEGEVQLSKPAVQPAQVDACLIPTQVRSEAANSPSTQAQPTPNPKKRKGRADRSKPSADQPHEFGVSRGIDFINVACVINFDLPTTAQSYTHRIGRTARAGRTGIALSFVSAPPSSSSTTRSKLKTDKKTLNTEIEEWKKIEALEIERGSKVLEYQFDMKQVEGFRYRMEDGLRAVTKAAVREARIKEIKHEVMNSEKLKAHFIENPTDLLFLKHDKPLHPTRIQAHLKHVPGYLIPQISNLPLHNATAQVLPSSAAAPGAATGTKAELMSVPFHQNSASSKNNRSSFNNQHQRNSRDGSGRGGRGGRHSSGGPGGRKRKDPLKKFSVK